MGDKDIFVNDDGEIIGVGSYSYDALDDAHKHFIDGMQFQIKTVDAVIADLDDEDESILAKLVKEIQETILNELKERMEDEICDALISFGDEEESENVDEQ